MANNPELPIYLQTDSENYREELNQTLLQLLNSDGWRLPYLTAAQVLLIASTAPRGAQWYNTDTNKMQIMTASGVVRSIDTTP